jgi:hypothetical protein
MNKELVEKWEKYNLLKGIDEDYKDILAQVLENQKSANEITIFDATFKRLSIPIARKTFAKLSLLNKLISIQPLSAPVGWVNYINNNKENIIQVATSIVKTRSIWNFEIAQDLAGMKVDAEAELAAILAQDLSTEITRKVLGNIKDNAALQKIITFKNLKEARIEILEFIQETKRRFHRPKANWMVTSPEIAINFFKLLKDNEIGMFGVSYWGLWEDINIYVDSLLPTGRILIGYRGEIPFDAGYIYSPYIPLRITPVELNPETFTPRRYVLHQSAHNMVDNTYFGCIKVLDFKED